MVIDNQKLQLSNPWWNVREAIRQDKKLLEFERMRYQYHHPLYGSLPHEDAVLTIRGPRQIGKTTLLKLLIRRLLLEEELTPGNVCYFACDAVVDFKELLQNTEEYLNAVRADNQDRIFLFLDEISFVREWQRAVKALVDEGYMQGVTAVLTGSNAIDLLFSSERLPGRRGKIFHPDIDCLPLDLGAQLA